LILKEMLNNFSEKSFIITLRGAKQGGLRGPRPLLKYFIVPETEMAMDDVMSSPHHAASLEECAEICQRHNEAQEGSLSGTPSYGFQHVNGFVFDAERQLCFLKNKPMANITPQQGPFTPSCAFYQPDKGRARYFSGYRWDALVNEINDVFPNSTSGMQNTFPAQALWSREDYGVYGNNCTTGQILSPSGGNRFPLCSENRQTHVKPTQYDVRPGAIFSPANNANTPDGRLPSSQPFAVSNMQECAEAATALARSNGGVPYSGTNAFTFYPNYSQAAGGEATNGQCVIGHVREPYYQTLRPEDKAAISGFALTSLSSEVHRFLFG
jgi:hypothetical protein